VARNVKKNRQIRSKTRANGDKEIDNYYELIYEDQKYSNYRDGIFVGANPRSSKNSHRIVGRRGKGGKIK